MSKTTIKETIRAKGIDIGIYTTDFENEYISLTDIAKYKSDEPNAVIQNWMRNKDVLEFLGLWELLHNLDFKPLEFEGFKCEENTSKKGNIRDEATIDQLLVLANMESYNAILIEQGKSQAERMGQFLLTIYKFTIKLSRTHFPLFTF